MSRARHVDALTKKLHKAVEVSLAATEAARDALQEILRRGADTAIFFSRGKKRETVSPELTREDREFLRAVSIRPPR